MSNDPTSTDPAALVEDVTSADLVALTAQTEAAISKAEAARSQLSPDARAAREAVQAAEFVRDPPTLQILIIKSSNSRAKPPALPERIEAVLQLRE